jgi:hypothetical protein
MWKINEMIIAHAGTVSSERTRGYFANTYNIVEVNESNPSSSKVWLKIINGEKMEMSEVVKQRETFIPQLTGFRLKQASWKA